MLAPIAALGTFQAIRDEFLSPGKQQNYRLPNFLPDWPWEWWALLFLVLFFIFAMESAFQKNRKQQLQPKLRCYFSLLDPGCKRTNTVITQTIQSPSGAPIKNQISCDWYRMKVETVDGVPAQLSCSARLTSIRRGSDFLMAGESSLLLPFAPGEKEDAINKTIHLGIPEFVDVVAITHDSKIFLPIHGNRVPSSIDWEICFLKQLNIFLILLSFPSMRQQLKHRCE